MTSVRTKPSTAFSNYQKEEVLKGLRDSVAAIERATKTWEEQIADWRVSVIEKFAYNVTRWEPGSYFDSRDFQPPAKGKLCDDWRLQNVNRAIGRISAMTPDAVGSIKLRADDPVFEYMALAACE